MQLKLFVSLGSSAMLIALWAVTSAQAQQGGIRNPEPLLKDGDRVGASLPEFTREAPGVTARTVARGSDPGARLELRLKRTEIYNPKRKASDIVWLRGYVDLEREERQRQGQEPAGSNLVAAPLIEATPGETVRIDLYNHLLPWGQLPLQPVDRQKEFTDAGLGQHVYEKLISVAECDHAGHSPENMNTPNDHPGCFNITNKHFHGGWVNPEGNSDNVLRQLHPGAGVVHEYEYNIPADHPAGTFWYHPHVHGSTAIQVASGMAGALIVRGDRWPERAKRSFRAGDVDVLLRKADGASIPDRIFLLQQIQYKCFQADGGSKTDFWSCGQDDIGAIVNYDNLGGQNNWDNSQRFTTVNGHLADALGVGSEVDDKVVAGQPERWRFIHAGFNDTINVQIFPAKPPASDAVASVGSALKNATAVEADATIKRLCEVDGDVIDESAIEMFEIAADGLTRMQALKTKSRLLQPGYRSDVLVSFPQPAEGLQFQEYCVIDVAAPKEQGVEGSLESKRLLFTVRVERNESPDQVSDAKTAIRNTMVTAAAQAAIARVRKGEDVSLLPAILSDLFDDLKLKHFSPHDTLIGAETETGDENNWEGVDNVRLLRFNLRSEQAGVPDSPGFGIGHKRFSRADYESKAGEEAISGLAPDALLNEFGDFRFSERPDELIALQLGDTDEWRLRSLGGGHPFHIHVNPFQVVRVTRLSDGKDLSGDEAPDSQYFGMKGVFKDTIMVESGVEVVIRSHYERYVGRFVLHCHILSHEDAGMMRLVEIFEPGIPGGLKRIEERAKELARILDLGRKKLAKIKDREGAEHPHHE